MVSTAEKYALEIEIFTLSKGLRAQISRTARKKSVFSSKYAGSLKGPAFSTQSTQICLSAQTEVGQKLPVAAGSNRAKAAL